VGIGKRLPIECLQEEVCAYKKLVSAGLLGGRFLMIIIDRFRAAVHSDLLSHILFVTVVISMGFLLHILNILLKIVMLY
jgi:hypothetical protein